MSFPIKNGGSFHNYVSLPEGIHALSMYVYTILWRIPHSSWPPLRPPDPFTPVRAKRSGSSSFFPLSPVLCVNSDASSPQRQFLRPGWRWETHGDPKEVCQKVEMCPIFHGKNVLDHQCFDVFCSKVFRQTHQTKTPSSTNVHFGKKHIPPMFEELLPGSNLERSIRD